MHSTSHNCTLLLRSAPRLVLTSHASNSKFAPDSILWINAIHCSCKSITAMQSKLLNGVAALALVALLSGQLTPTVAYSQCPTSMLPSFCSWIPGGGQTSAIPIPGTGCFVTAQYCYACCDGINYFYIHSMNTTGTGCSNVDPQVLQDLVVNFLFRQTSLYGCSPCPNGETQTSVYTPGCWQKNMPMAPWLYGACTDAGCYCFTSATVTCTDGVVTLSNCTSARMGSCDCAVKPPQGTPWNVGTCYALECSELTPCN